MKIAGSRTLIALAFQLSALFALGLAVLGASWLDARHQLRVLALVDRSHSVPRAASDKAVAEVAQATRARSGMALQVVEFAGKAGRAGAEPADATDELEPAATDIERALDAALAVHAESPLTAVVVVSDGQETRGDASRALHAARDARLPVQWYPVARPSPPAHVTEVLAPERAQVGQNIQVTVGLAGKWDRPLRLRCTARTSLGDVVATTREVTSEGWTTLDFDVRHAGAVLVDIALEDPASGQILDARAGAAVVDVAPRAPILVARGSAGPLAASLLDGGWSLNVIPATRLDSQTEGLDAYRAVVLDDVAISDASPRFWQMLVTAVQERGIGLMVLGGERSFARGGYRGSVLESVLPVSSEPAALDDPVSVIFAVDKSGSMGLGTGGVDRLQLAQRAVLETSRGLGPRDRLGLVVFDVTPRVLLPLGPAKDGMATLEHPWPTSPKGGTRLGPALETATSELERSTAGRRMLVVVTDGFVDNAPLTEWRARLAQSRIETVALAVGPDADVTALERLVGPDEGLVLRVDQAAELPIVMRSGLERRRAHVERGTIAVEQVRPLPFVPANLGDWPAIAAHAATRPRQDAVVAVQTRRGEPLLAFRQAGRGHVVTVTSGLGPWTPRWLHWRHWPQLAGGLASWVSDPSSGPVESVTVSDLPAAMQVDALVGPGSRSIDRDIASIEVDGPTQRARRLTLEHVAPGRWRALLPDAGAGLYTFLVSTSTGTRRHLHLRHQRSEHDGWGLGPSVAVWKASGLVKDWDPELLTRGRSLEPPHRPVDRSLVGLAFVLFVAGILVDRPPLDLNRLRHATRRRRDQI